MRRLSAVLLASVLFALGILLLPALSDEEGETMSDHLFLENEYLRLEADISSGVRLMSFYGKEAQKEYLLRPSPLFSARVTDQMRIGGYHKRYECDSREMTVLGAGQTQDTISLTLEKDGVLYEACLRLSGERQGFTLRVNVVNGLDEAILVRLALPCLEAVAVSGSAENRMGMIPNEIGSVAAFGRGRFGPDPDAATGMPQAFNAMETAAVYDRESGAGLAFFPFSGSAGGNEALIQMQLSASGVYGYWAGHIEEGQSAAPPVLAVCLLHDGWQEAIDLYKACHEGFSELTDDIPSWIRECGAVYSAKREGTGGSYQCLSGTKDLNTRISSFLQLPELLEEAQAFGTNVLELIDYYDRADLSGAKVPDEWMGAAQSPYWNKGDYRPRSDLGGEEAFREGIRLVHEMGGRVIVYVEPYIVFQYSQLGRRIGDTLAAHQVSGLVDRTYIMNYTMQPAAKAWQDIMVEICCRLVREYGVDGIQLDSLGWQWNRLYFTESERVIYSMQEYNRGLIELVKRVRSAIRKIRPDAVVMAESGSGPLIGLIDGGFTADWCWNNNTGTDLITVSPTKYAYPTANFFSSGTTMNSLYQVFAAGFGLSLCDYWQGHEEEIRPLVELRREYADALIRAVPQYPAADRKNVGAYRYRGTEHELLTVVNAGNPSSKQRIDLTKELAGSEWEYLYGGEGCLTADELGILEIRVPSESLAVLIRK